jgi:N-acetylglucosaminyldiphosphoundecaprenol N-acetyl-beta-D-mannosaminyltransferase
MTVAPVAAEPLGRRDDTVEMFGVRIDALDMAATVDRVFEIVERGRPTQHVVLNAAKVVEMERRPELRAVVGRCGMVNADGASIVWASRVLGRPVPERVTGIDLFGELVGRAATTGHSVFLLGATDDVVGETRRRLEQRHPALRIAGARNGFWAEDRAVVDEIRAAAPDLLFVALPSPRKEFWLDEHLDGLGVPFVMGVGGTFDVVAGRVRRAPRWAQRTGTEWAFRLAQEPGRMWRRYLVGNTVFVALTVRERWRDRARWTDHGSWRNR